MPNRRYLLSRRSSEQTALAVSLLVTFLAVTGALLITALFDLVALRRELADSAATAAPRVAQSLRSGDAAHALDGLGGIASAKLYAPDGRLLAETPPAPGLRPGLATSLASKYAAAEIVCGKTGSDTLCTEPAVAPVVVRIAWWLRVLAGGALAALLLGALAGALIARMLRQRIANIADTVDRAAREHDYSHRIASDAGAAGALGSSLNTLLAQIQEREATLRRRTTELEGANKELEGFSYAVAHDLRNPLGSVDGFAQALWDEYRDVLDDTGREYLDWMRQGCDRMRELIDGLLEMARLARAEMAHDEVDLSSIARSVAETLKQKAPERQVRFEIRDGAKTVGDPRLLRAVVENLMNNAFKFTRGREAAQIEFGVIRNGNEPAFYVRDNGAGFDPTQAARMFRPFQRLHSSSQFEGTGIGLATVQKIMMRHGGKAWAEGEVGKGATIYFTAGSDHAVHA